MQTTRTGTSCRFLFDEFSKFVKLPIDKIIIVLYYMSIGRTNTDTHGDADMKHSLIASGAKESITVKIDGEQYAEMQRLVSSGLMVYEAVASVLGIDPETDFVTSEAGTSSRTQDAMFVKFF